MPDDSKRSAAETTDTAGAKRAKVETAKDPDKIPISLLSGFLGAGKTTLLRHILTNKEGTKVGIIVNDVAEINIDAKLVRNQDKGGVGEDYAVGKSDMLELQNGCVCCSASDELFTNLDRLITNNRRPDGRPDYDHIVIECSGVAEPKMVRDKFQEGILDGLPLLQEVALRTLVTVVDGSSFLAQWESKEVLDERPDLGGDEYGEGGGERQLVDLLVEQIECADVLVLNKMDQVDAKQQQVLTEICHSLNPKSTNVAVEFGKVDVSQVLRSGAGTDGIPTVAEGFGDEDHQRAVRIARELQSRGPARPDPRAPVRFHRTLWLCIFLDGNDRVFVPGLLCLLQGAFAQNLTQKPEKEAARHASIYGIGSFVYTRRRPFHPVKLSGLIKKLPVSVNAALELNITPQERQNGDAPPAAPVDTAAPASAANEGNGQGQAEGDIKGDNGVGAVAGAAQDDTGLEHVIRSKGFTWLATYHTAALYWSHAGTHFELKNVGSWWAAVEPQNLPDGAVPEHVVGDFEGEFGDRRQEIIFIGMKLDEDKIVAALDACLLSEKEMAQYQKHWQAQDARKAQAARSAQGADVESS